MDKRKVINRLCNGILIMGVLIVVYWLLQVTTTCSFHTTSGSMSPTILPGESGLVNKWKMGARIFNMFEAASGNKYEIRRLPGYGQLERGDVIVFNYPNLETNKDSIAMSLSLHYCKRAVAIARDTLDIIDGFYRVRGTMDTLGVISEQKQLSQYITEYAKKEPDIHNWRSWMRFYPKDSIVGWTIKDMGPFLIPGEGTVIDVDRKNWLLYRRYIEWETGGKLEWKDSVAVMNGRKIRKYRFKENYCFAAGDHVIDSRDSRYFGLVPEKFIVGTAGILWKTKDRKRWLKQIR